MFQLPEALTFANVKETQQELTAHLRQKEPAGEAIFDAGSLRDMDAAGLQLLLALCKSLMLEGRPYKLVNISPFVQHLFEISGGAEVAFKEAAGYE